MNGNLYKLYTMSVEESESFTVESFIGLKLGVQVKVWPVLD